MSDVPSPKLTPRAIETLNDSKKIPIPWKIEDIYISVPWNRDKVLQTVSAHAKQENTDAETHSYMTILTASFNKLSPKMTLYNLGSTLYCWKIARIVTGSVADSVDPNMRHSSSVRSSDSKPRNEYIYTKTLFCK